LKEINKKMKQRGYWWLIWIASIVGISATWANDQQRYLAILLLNLDRSPTADLDLLEDAVKAGCNAVHLTIHWDQVYPTTTSQADWLKYDNQIALAQKLGVKVALRIHLGRNEARMQGFWTNDDRQRDHQGKVLLGAYSTTFFSYAHRPSVEKARVFIKEVCQRYLPQQKQGVISWVSVTTTPTQELGYHYENAPDGSGVGTYAALYDYSAVMQQEFRIWLGRKYKKIARLNALWQTEYGSFENVVPPVSLKNLTQTFWDPSGRDWYVFRHAMLKLFIEQTTETIKGVSASFRVVTDMGSVFDGISGIRGTYGFVDLNRSTDGIKINDAIEYDNRFSADVVRSNAYPDKWVLNEAFAAPSFDRIEIARQIDENYAHGTRWLSVVIGTRASLEHVREIIQKVVTQWLKTPYVSANPRASMTYSLSRVLEFGYFSGGVYGEWVNRAGPESNRQPVDIRMVEDLLADSLQGSINRAPFVKNILPTKTIRVNSNFSYRLSSEVFIDIDGAIGAVEIKNLPDWLKFSNNTFSGTPTRTGTFIMTLRATDDDGAAVETNFTIIVNEAGQSNLYPTVRKRISDAIALYKQPLILAVSDSNFVDYDGFIGRIELIGLPTWAQYRKGEIRGLADTTGEYIITVKAYDDEEAAVTTTFKITVNYPTVLFDLIQAGKPGQRFLIKRLTKNDVLLEHTLPPSLNIYASCDAIFDAFDLELSGAYTRTVKTTRSPYSLFDGDGGFPTVAGKYSLKGTAYFRKELIATTTYSFEILPTDPVSKTPITLADWTVYPNPARDFLQITLPANISSPQIQLVSLLGVGMPIAESAIFKSVRHISLNLQQLSLSSGIYFLKLQNEDGTWRVFKVVKQ
jgi:hypothetical protein